MVDIRPEETASRETIWRVLKRVVAENGRGHARSYAFAIFCLVIVALTTAFSAWIMEAVINETFQNRRADIVWMICLSVFAAFTLRGFATYGQAVTLSKVGNSIVASYQKRLYAHLMALSVGYFSEARSARLAAQISENVSGIRDMLNLAVTSLARDVLTVIALVAVMISKDWVLTAIVFVVAPPLVLALRYVSRRLRTATRDSVAFNSHVMGAMQETVQGIAIVKAFTMERLLTDKVEALIGQAERRANTIARLTERTAPLTETFAGLAIASVIGYAAWRSIEGGEMPGAFFAFVTALLMAYDPAKRLARLQVQLERATVNARMIYDILDEKPALPDAPDAPDLVVSRGEVVLENVHFAYGSGKPVLAGVSLVAEGGRTTALVGPSGAGKSTIISLVERFHAPDSGRILIDGQDISSVSTASLRRALAYVSQQPWLFEGTIADNIRYGRPEASDAEVEAAARLAEAHDFILAQPQGYQTPVGEGGQTLSGGQRQRLSIARALIRNAPILLLDEATSALDNESEAAVQKALDGAMAGRTVIVVAHRLSTIANAGHIVVMDRGQVVEQGTHKDLAAEPGGLYARLNALMERGGAFAQGSPTGQGQ